MRRLETFLTSPGQAGPARQPLGRTICWLENPRPAPFPLQQSSNETWSPEVLMSNQNSLSNSVSKWPPWSNQCPETSTEQKTIKKTCGFCQGPTACQKDGRWKSDRRGISQMNLLLNYITVTTNIAGDLLEPAWIRDSPRKQSSLEAEKSWSGVTSSMGVCERSARVEGINSLKYQEVLAASYIPNHKRGQILQQDGAPSHTSISTSKFLKAKKIKVLQDWPAQSPDMNIIGACPGVG